MRCSYSIAAFRADYSYENRALALFYRWQKELFENGASAFKRPSDVGPDRKLESKVEALEKKLADKDEVIGEIMESHVRLKKSLGET